ncbi:MAG: hypothetical protein ACYDEV_11005 [Acidiferrobacter sp.]
MDYQQAENQLATVQQQTQTSLQKLQTLAQKLTAAAPDPTTGREWAMDLREVALAVQNQAQNTTMLVQQMAEYIRRLEGDIASHPSPTVQPTGWANQARAGGGGFLSSLTSGLGMGAGFAVADDLVGDLFNMF